MPVGLVPRVAGDGGGSGLMVGVPVGIFICAACTVDLGFLPREPMFAGLERSR